MRRSSTIQIGALALVLLLAAAGPATAQEAEPAPEVEAWSAQTTPIEGTLVGVDWIDSEAPGCAPGSSWRFHSSGTGEIVGIGSVDFVLTQCSVFGPETLTGTFGDGTITFTTADGDTLEIAQTGYAEGVPGRDGLIGWTMGGSWQAVGGTGRFEGASGYGWIGGLGDVGQGVPDARYSFRGNIEYGPAESAEAVFVTGKQTGLGDAPYEWSDPRLDGTIVDLTASGGPDVEAPDGIDPWFDHYAFTIENEDGVWRTRPQLRFDFDFDPDDHPWMLGSEDFWWVLDGEDAYEGLVAVLLWERGPYPEVHGVIAPSDSLPPAPEGTSAGPPRAAIPTPDVGPGAVLARGDEAPVRVEVIETLGLGECEEPTETSFVCEVLHEWSDPRLQGTSLALEVNGSIELPDGGELGIFNNIYNIETENGAWRMRPQLRFEFEGSPELQEGPWWWVLDGDGTYEGLSLLLIRDRREGVDEPLHGFIVSTDVLPPAPEGASTK